MGPEVDRSSIYRIDGEDHLTFVSAAWLEFAQANMVPDLTEQRVLGRVLWDFISDAETIHLYMMILEAVRAARRTVTVPFRCDSPDCRRLMELRLYPVHGGIEFDARLIRSEPRDEVAFLDPRRPRSLTPQRTCCWCKRLDVDGEWLEVESALQRLRLFEAAPLPMLTHVVCSDCRGRVLGSLS